MKNRTRPLNQATAKGDQKSRGNFIPNAYKNALKGLNFSLVYRLRGPTLEGIKHTYYLWAKQ